MIPDRPRDASAQRAKLVPSFTENHAMAGAGKLWVVATPIGNLDDLSPRAREVLGSVDVIAAEDTRHSAPLLRHFGIATKCVALHEHNERDATGDLVNRMLDGATFALISDAGTPLISDPGFRLVRAAREAGIEVNTVPGACAAIAALSIAGLPSDRFVFEGFLPNKSAARRAHLESLRAELRTLIFYESSHRIVDTLRDAAQVYGERQAVIARELTKLYETVLADTLPALLARVERDADQQRGEFVLIVSGSADDSDAMRLVEGRRVYDILRRELPPGRAAKVASEITGAPRNALYAVGDVGGAT
jgi:16S rRNA (cytidine1402-2'-O)-methyltransferase